MKAKIHTFRRVGDQSGVTLLEVMVAMVILSVSLLLLLNMGMVALNANDWSNKTTVAVQRLQEKFEQLRGTANPTSGSDTVDNIERTWTVGSEASYLRRVTVNVLWEDVRGQHHTSSMSTLIRTDSL